MMKLNKFDQAILDWVPLFGIDGEIDSTNSKKEADIKCFLNGWPL